MPGYFEVNLKKKNYSTDDLPICLNNVTISKCIEIDNTALKSFRIVQVTN